MIHELVYNGWKYTEAKMSYFHLRQQFLWYFSLSDRLYILYISFFLYAKIKIKEWVQVWLLNERLNKQRYDPSAAALIPLCLSLMSLVLY